MVAGIINMAMRGLQLFWTVLVLALVGNMIHVAIAGNPAIINYDIFVGVFGLLSLCYLIPATFMESLRFHPMLMVGLDALNALLWFCAAVPMSAYLGVHSCGNTSYLESNFITNGAYNMTKRCHEAQASTAFLWFGFAAFTVSAVLSGLEGKSSGGMRGGMGGIRRGGPSMSQV